MSEPKPFASLSSGLLARKGAARPAMRPQGFTPTNSGLEDLGWNDMGSDPSQPDGDADDQVVEHPRANHHRTGLSPVQSPVHSPVHSQQAELVDRLNESDEDFDEDFDETAEPYEPETGSGSFNGFASPSFDEDEDEAAPEPEFRVQMKTPKRPLDLGPAPETLEEPLDLGSTPDAFDEPLELDEPVVVAQQPAPVVVAARVPVVAVSAKAKAAFTLRLDPDRHLKLRLACAVRGRSAQQLVTDALDAFLSGMPELDDMAEKAKKRG